MAFVLRAERNADSSIFYLPEGFDNYLTNVTNGPSIARIFDDNYFRHLPVTLRVPVQQPLPPVPHVVPGAPPQVPPPANNNGTGMGFNHDDDDDDDDDQSFSDEDDASCGNSGNDVKGDSRTDTVTDATLATVTETEISASEVQIAQATSAIVETAQSMMTNVDTTQTVITGVQATQATQVITNDWEALRNRQAAVLTNHANALPTIVARAQAELDAYESTDYDTDDLSTASWDSHDSEDRFRQTHWNEEATLQGDGPVNAGDDEPEPSGKVTFTLRATNERPDFSLDQLRGSSIASMLPNFLARMDAANQELDAERIAGTLVNRRIEIDEDQNASENDQYIEMNLGLGVLEEQGEEVSSSSDNEASSSTTEDIMQRLLGGKRKRDAEEEDHPEVKKAKIEEL